MTDSDENPLDLAIPHKDLPSTLWHVRHGGSQSCAAPQGGFTAASGFRKLKNDADLALQAALHFDWYTHTYEATLDWKSPFISVFDNKRHAENWGKQRERPVLLYEIDTTQLSPETVVFSAVELCGAFGEIDHPWAEDEFLFLNSIPSYCFVAEYCLCGDLYIQQPYISDGVDLGTFSRLPMSVGLPASDPTSPAREQLRELPTASASTEDDVDNLVNSFNDALHLDDAPTRKSSTSGIRRGNGYWYITF
ncbi:hypothetical protein B0T20DRAFT_114204 [Sordaria brevicollis]|uniref:DUF7587 domain-containing protein n=1 Tax=Sordaria brevicollis TaxID=83679 RepID=A0AAE0PK76_SORBR|nr:hypothetical protein B0T20DRAFT_114204 [Sordaria brevicollis]